MKKIIFIIMILYCVVNVEMAFAENHYIRAGATGNNNGSDWTNAWTAIPPNLVRGDTYYIADGDYGTNEHNFKDPESSSTNIYIKKATPGEHGTNVGWNDSFGSGCAQMGSIRFSTSYYVLDGSSRISPTSGYGIKLRGTMASQKIIFFYNDEIKPQPSNITIKYVEMEHRGRNTETSDDIVYGIDYGLGGVKNITIQYCYLHDCGRGQFLFRGADNVLIEHSWISRNSSSPVNHACGLSDGNSRNITIRYNVWEDIEGTSFIETMYGNADSWAIYGNVFFHSSSYGVPPNNEGVSGVIRVLNDSSNTAVATNWKIYNNTIANIIGLWSGFRIDAGSNNYAYNNLWYNCIRTAHYRINISHSWYYNTQPDGDTNNVQYGAENPFASLAGKNFRLRSATNSGFPLASPYNADMDGRTRGADGHWDRGAYEFNSGATSMSAPGNFRLSR